MTIALTHSKGRLKDLYTALIKRGYKVIHAPLIATKSLDTAELRQQASQLYSTCSWLLFTSSFAVNAWHRLGQAFSRLPNPLYLGAVGKKTALSLEEFAKVTLIAEPQNAEGLTKAFLSHAKAASPIGLPQGDIALDTLEVKLKAAGYKTKPLVIYKTHKLPWQNPAVDIVVLASPSAVSALPESVATSTKLIALGATTLKAIQKRGWKGIKADAPDVESLIQAIERPLT